MPRLGPGSGGGGGGDSAGSVPAGEYIVALKSFKRQVGKTSGQDFLRCRWVICAGPLEGKSFFSNMSCDLSKEGTVNRWRILMEACDVTEEFEIGSTREGTGDEGDQNIRELFRNIPIKVTLKVEKNGNYENHDIQMIHYVRSWTDADKAAMDKWLDAQDNAGQPDRPEDSGGGGGMAPPVEEDDYGPVGGGTKAGGYAGGDDDIPF